LSKLLKNLIGIATLVQLLMVLSYVVAIFNDFETIHLTTICYFGLVNIWTLFLQVLYMVDLFNSVAIPKNEKTKWIVLLLLLSPITMPIYWIKHLRP